MRHKAIAKPLGRSVRLRNKIRKFIKTCCNTVYLKLKYNSCLISFSTAILISFEKNGNFKISFCTFELRLFWTMDGRELGAGRHVRNTLNGSKTFSEMKSPKLIAML